MKARNYISSRKMAGGERKKFKWGRLALLAAAGLGLYHILSGPAGALNLFKLHRENRSLRGELDSLETRRHELAVEKARLQNDSAYLEKVARKELGMSKPGEEVFRFMKTRKDPGKGP